MKIPSITNFSILKKGINRRRENPGPPIKKGIINTENKPI